MSRKSNLFAALAGIAMVFGSHFLSAQSQLDTLTIYVAGRAADGRVVLRWVPADYNSWAYGNLHGYKVTRTTLVDAGNELSATARQASRTVMMAQLLPLPEAQWKMLADTNQLAIVAAGSLYSPTFDTPMPVDADPNVVNENDTRTNRFSFGLFAADQFLDIAQGMALAFVDQTVRSGSVYRYAISYAKEDSRKALFRSGEITVAADHRIRLRPPAELSAQWQNRKVRLTWNRSRVDTLYSAYFVERSEDAGASFVRVNKSPLIYITPEGTYDPSMYYVDSLADNETEYLYRVRGKTPFGELGPPSDRVSGKGKKASLTSPPGIVFMESIPDQAGMQIGWIVDSLAFGRISGFNLYESIEKGGLRKKLNPAPISAEVRQFAVNHIRDGHYYQVGLLDDTGHELFSTAKMALVRDDTPPMPPSGLKGKMDSNGKALMTWQSNPEEDIQGYRIYTGNHETGYFAELTYLSVVDTFYRQAYSMNTLHEAEFFKVRAIDLRGNYSEFSNPEKIIRPDIHPPSPPVFTQVRAAPAFVALRWANSSSDDVVHHTLERRALDEPTWFQLRLFSANEQNYTSYTDSSGIPGRQYEYRLIATDQSGLNSTSTSAQSGRIDDGRRGAIRNFSAAFDAGQEKLLLSWQFDRLGEADRFLLYRSLENQPLGVYKPLKKNTPGMNMQGTIAHMELPVQRSGNRFQYRLLAILKDGGYSDLSDALFVDH